MPRQKEFDYDEKLKEARNLFWKKGYNATSLNDLVDTLKINRSSLYLTYGSKHDLFLKALVHYITQKNQEYSEAASKYEDPLQAIENVLWSVVDIIIKDDKSCLATNSVFELARIDKQVNKLLRQQTLTAVAIFEKLLEKAKNKGMLKQHTDPLALAHFLIANITSIWKTHILFGDKKLTRQMTEMLIASIPK
jgi:TetR/AcrR family transcriptional repressor of nem operon